MQQTYTILVEGRVQGVSYRQSALEKACALGVTGTVRNLPHGRVELVATGTQEQLQELLQWCRQGPPRARVSNIAFEIIPLQLFAGFEIVRMG